MEGSIFGGDLAETRGAGKRGMNKSFGTLEALFIT